MALVVNSSTEVADSSTVSMTDSDDCMIKPYHPLRILDRQISLPEEFSSYTDIKTLADIDKIENREHRYRLKLQIFFLSKAFQIWLSSLIATDLILVLVDLVILLIYCELGEHEPHEIEILIEIIEILSIIILSIFEIEFGVQLWAFGLNWLKNIVHIFDVIVVTATLILEIIFFYNEEVESIVGLLVLLRLWRLFRVVYVTAEALEVKLEEKEHQEKKLKKKIKELKAEIDTLRNGNKSE